MIRSHFWWQRYNLILAATADIVHHGFGADSSAVQDKLSSGVRKVFSTIGSFAALKEDGSVVVWGDSLEYGAGVTSDQINSGVIDIFLMEILMLP